MWVHLVICLLPWLALLPGVREIPPATLLVGVVILMAVPMMLSSAGWDFVLADVVPPRRRSRIVSIRSMTMALISLAMAPLMGSFLE